MRLALWMLKLKGWWLALLLALLGLGAAPLQHALRVNNSLDIWFNQNSPALRDYYAFQQYFGSDEHLIVMLEAEESLLLPQAQKQIHEVHNALLALPEIANVLSGADLRMPEAGPLGLRFRQLFSHSPIRQRQLLDSFPDFRNQLFSSDYRNARLLLQLHDDGNLDNQRAEVVAAVRRVVEKHWDAEAYALGGVSVIFAELNALTELQFGRFLVTAYIFMLLLMWWIFGSWRVCLVAFATMSTATYLCLAVYGSLGFQLNLMTVLIPMLVLLLSILDLVHLLHAWHKQATQPITRAIAEVWKACLLTTLTTMAGFLALCFSPMAILQQFGLFSALGIGLCLPLTWLFALLLLPGNSKSQNQPIAQLKTARLYPWLNKYKGAISLGVMATVLVFGLGVSRLKSDTYTLGYLPANNKVLAEHQRLTEKIGPYMPLEILLIPDTSAQLTDSAGLHALLLWRDKLTASGYHPHFGLPHLLEAASLQTSTALKEQLASHAPQAMKLLKQHYPQLLSAYWDVHSGMGRLTLFGPMQTAQQLADNLDTLSRLHTETAFSVKPAGYLPLYAQLVPYATQSQTRSLVMAAIMISLLLYLYFRDIAMSLRLLCTNAFPVLGMFAFMGFAGIELDIATASIAAIGLSYCIDDSIHFSLRYRRCRKAGQDHADAMKQTYEHTGTAILTSSLVLFMGFACMLFSPLKTVYLFGLLSCVMIVLALLSQLLLFGLLFSKTDNTKAHFRRPL
ncbi:MAG: efflux RND transporter permease subunit [Bacteroidia bacterium]